MSFSVEFLGCKISQTDMQGVRERLLAGGLEEAREAGAVHVVNTCCVTNEAVAKSRKAVRAALRRGAEHVYVTGCATRLGTQSLALEDARVTVVRETAEEAAERIAREPRRDRLRRSGASAWSARARSSRCRTAARSAARSASFRGCAAAAARDRSAPCSRRRAGASHRATASWSSRASTCGLYRDAAARAKLADVIAALAELDGVARVRLSSIEVNHLDRRLCESLAHPRVCPHLHVPLQSGDDGVLRAMRRRYDLATYARRIELARQHVPGLNLTGDVIVGFPAEDGPAFARTLEAVAGARVLAPARVPVLAAAGDAHGRCRSRAAGRQAPPCRAAARALRPARARPPRGARRRPRPRPDRARGRRTVGCTATVPTTPRTNCGHVPAPGSATSSRSSWRPRASGLHGGGCCDRSHRQGRQDAP